MIETLDRNVGRLLRAIDDVGAADNTIFIFFSDNGGVDWRSLESPTSNRPLREGKGTTYDGGTRVPLIISAPRGVKAGSVSDTPVMSMDLYPTLLELAGVAPKPGIKCDGISITPAFSGRTLGLGAVWRQAAAVGRRTVLEGSRLDRRRAAVGLERTGALEHGLAATGRLEG